MFGHLNIRPEYAALNPEYPGFLNWLPILIVNKNQFYQLGQGQWCLVSSLRNPCQQVSYVASN